MRKKRSRDVDQIAPAAGRGKGRGRGRGKGAGARQRPRRCHWRPHFWEGTASAFRRVLDAAPRGFFPAGSGGQRDVQRSFSNGRFPTTGIPEIVRAEGEGFFLPKNAGVSDNAAGVGARLLLSLSLSRARAICRRRGFPPPLFPEERDHLARRTPRSGGFFP